MPAFLSAGSVAGRRSGPRPIYGVSGLNADTIRYETDLDGGEPGVASGFGSGMLCRYDAPNAGLRVPMARFSSGQQGYEGCRINNNVVTCSFRVGANNTTVTSSAATLVAGDVGKWFLYGGQHANVAVRAYLDGLQVGTDQSISGYTAADALTRFYLGLRQGTIGACPGLTIAGFVQWRGIPTAQNFADWFLACKAASCVVDMPGVGITNTNLWCVGHDQDGVSAPAVITNLKGGSNLTRVGAPTLVADSAPVWRT